MHARNHAPPLRAITIPGIEWASTRALRLPDDPGIVLRVVSYGKSKRAPVPVLRAVLLEKIGSHRSQVSELDEQGRKVKAWVSNSRILHPAELRDAFRVPAIILQETRLVDLTSLPHARQERPEPCIMPRAATGEESPRLGGLAGD